MLFKENKLRELSLFNTDFDICSLCSVYVGEWMTKSTLIA